MARVLTTEITRVTLSVKQNFPLHWCGGFQTRQDIGHVLISLKKFWGALRIGLRSKKKTMACPTHGVNPNSKQRVVWDILMMCCLIWVASASARAHARACGVARAAGRAGTVIRI